ncbi:MAG: protein kinase, partial [Planctomycetota bacterium]|nr:protein kinase [Planctomycetota bacterium]
PPGEGEGEGRPSAPDLRFPPKLSAKEKDTGLAIRLGAHLGEVVVEERQDDKKPLDLYGLQVDTAARIMSLGEGGQILCTRAIFDNARQVLKGRDLGGLEPLVWLNHGLYLMKGVDEPIEVCEVGEEGLGVLRPPAASEKARPADGSVEELGWRPAPDGHVPGTEWLLEEKIGQGGFGEVWRAAHRATKEKRVFKFCFHRDRLRALRRELALFQVIRQKIGEHPGIVRLHEVYLKEAPYYLGMEFVPGHNLRDWLLEGERIRQLSTRAKLEIVAQVADALDVAHKSGVIHQDLKPQNMLVDEVAVEVAPGVPRTKLSDFGVGRVVNESVISNLGITSGASALLQTTKSGTESGTLLYMAPERVEGQSASPQSDLYSLGVVLYQMMACDLNRAVTPEWAKDIPDPIVRADLRALLAGKPDGRLASAAELATRLRAWSGRRKSLAVKRFVLVAAAVLVLVAGAFGIWKLRQYELQKQKKETTQATELAARLQREEAQRRDKEAQERQAREAELKRHESITAAQDALAKLEKDFESANRPGLDSDTAGVDDVRQTIDRLESLHAGYENWKSSVERQGIAEPLRDGIETAQTRAYRLKEVATDLATFADRLGAVEIGLERAETLLAESFALRGRALPRPASPGGPPETPGAGAVAARAPGSAPTAEQIAVVKKNEADALSILEHASLQMIDMHSLLPPVPAAVAMNVAYLVGINDDFSRHVLFPRIARCHALRWALDFLAVPFAESGKPPLEDALREADGCGSLDRVSGRVVVNHGLAEASLKVWKTSCAGGFVKRVSLEPHLDLDIKSGRKVILSIGTYDAELSAKGHRTMSFPILILLPGEETTVSVPLLDEKLFAAGGKYEGMTIVPGGEFLSGAPGPGSVLLFASASAPFAIDTAEVSIAGYRSLAECPVSGADAEPVRRVSAKDALAFAEQKGKRLPTGLEWEKAARGVDGRDLPWGMAVEEAGKVAKIASLGSTVAPVTSETRDLSPYGCRHMAGNVREWVLRDDGSDTAARRTAVRGGGITLGAEKARCYMEEEGAGASPFCGFRCAANIEGWK